MAQIDLGLSEDEFWQLTPRQFSALLARKREEREYSELLAGIVAAAVANFSLGAPKKPLTAAHFMPSQFERMKRESRSESKRAKRALAAEQVRAYFTAKMAQQQEGLEG